jgi:hypothetical protein
MADDRFWAGVRERLLRTDGELPLLESWSATTSRWHLIDGTRAETVRALLKPGALLTVYPDPPRAADDALATRAHQLDLDNHILGLIQESEVGTLRFARLRTTDEVTSWLSRAQHARVCGLYPSDPARQPGAVQAVVPPAEPMPEPPSNVESIPTGRLLLRGALGLLVLLTAATLYGLAGRTLFAVRDHPPPTLNALESRAGCTDHGDGIDLQGPVENGSCDVDGTTVTLATFRNDSDRDTWIAELRLVGSQHFGIGPGWAIEADNATTTATVAAALGGRAISYEQPLIPKTGN